MKYISSISMYNLVTFIKTETKFIINVFCVFFILLLLCYINCQNLEGYVAEKGNSYNAERKEISFAIIAKAQQKVENIKSNAEVYLRAVRHCSDNHVNMFVSDSFTCKTYVAEFFKAFGFSGSRINSKEMNYLINQNLVNSYTMRDELIINGKLQTLNNNASNPE